MEKAEKLMLRRIVGNFCVVVRTDGIIEAKQMSEVDDIFNESKKIIGCRFLDHFVLQNISPSCKIECLVNDEGYFAWQDDPTKVNQIATFFYNGGDKPGHYVLGDAVFCLSVYKEEDGWDFVGMVERLAKNLSEYLSTEILSKAKENCPIPAAIPDPFVKVSSYDSYEDMMKVIQGDKSLKPSSETIISGKEPNAEKKD